jgi:Family of unknown function (DUF6152)
MVGEHGMAYPAEITREVFMRLIIGVLSTCALAVATTAIAHHSFAMFDTTKTVVLQGTVAEFAWANPHMHIRVLVPKGDAGIEGEWDVEGASTNISAREGWTRSTFTSGDKITVTVHPLRDGTRGGSLMYALAPDGRKLYHDINRQGGGGPAGAEPPPGSG